MKRGRDLEPVGGDRGVRPTLSFSGSSSSSSPSIPRLAGHVTIDEFTKLQLNTKTNLWAVVFDHRHPVASKSRDQFIQYTVVDPSRPTSMRMSVKAYINSESPDKLNARICSGSILRIKGIINSVWDGKCEGQVRAGFEYALFAPTPSPTDDLHKNMTDADKRHLEDLRKWVNFMLPRPDMSLFSAPYRPTTFQEIKPKQYADIVAQVISAPNLIQIPQLAAASPPAPLVAAMQFDCWDGTVAGDPKLVKNAICPKNGFGSIMTATCRNFRDNGAYDACKVLRIGQWIRLRNIRPLFDMDTGLLSLDFENSSFVCLPQNHFDVVMRLQHIDRLAAEVAILKSSAAKPASMSSSSSAPPVATAAAAAADSIPVVHPIQPVASASSLPVAPIQQIPIKPPPAPPKPILPLSSSLAAAPIPQQPPNPFLFSSKNNDSSSVPLSRLAGSPITSPASFSSVPSFSSLQPIEPAPIIPKSDPAPVPAAATILAPPILPAPDIVPSPSSSVSIIAEKPHSDPDATKSIVPSFAITNIRTRLENPTAPFFSIRSIVDQKEVPAKFRTQTRIIGYSPDSIEQFCRPICPRCNQLAELQGPDRLFCSNKACDANKTPDIDTSALTFRWLFKLILSCEGLRNGVPALVAHDDAVLLLGGLSAGNLYVNNVTVQTLRDRLEYLVRIGKEDYRQLSLHLLKYVAGKPPQHVYRLFGTSIFFE